VCRAMVTGMRGPHVAEDHHDDVEPELADCPSGQPLSDLSRVIFNPSEVLLVLIAPTERSSLWVVQRGEDR
jgi:hypothetical protein